MIKVVNGKESILGVLQDGGYSMNEWYILGLKLERGMFDLYMQKQPEKKALKTISLESMDKVLYCFDSVFSSGSVGLGMNGLSQFIVDEIDVEPLECVNIKTELVNHYHTHLCNSFKEGFDSYFQDTWTNKDNEQKMKTPSEWSYG